MAKTKRNYNYNPDGKGGEYGILGGRPSKHNEQTVKKLEDILRIGGTIEEACVHAKIKKQTYYNWVDQKEGFLTRMSEARQYSDIAAKKVVVQEIYKNKDVTTAKWWLEKRQPQSFGGKLEDKPSQNNQLNIYINDGKLTDDIVGFLSGLGQGGSDGETSQALSSAERGAGTEGGSSENTAS